MTERPRYDPGAHVAARDDLVCLHRNENLFASGAWTGIGALAARCRAERYPDPGATELRSAIARHHGVETEQVFVGNGSDEVLASLFALNRTRFATVHVLDVGFRVYPMLAARFGYGLSPLPGETFVTGRVHAPDGPAFAVVDSPNALTGARVSTADLTRLAEAPGSCVVWDNVYGEFAGDPAVPPGERFVVVRSFSKFYALAGLRLGYCLAEPGLIAQLDGHRDVFNVNALAQAAGLEALRRHAEFAGFAAAAVEARRRLAEALEAVGFEVRPGHGNFVLASHPRCAATDIEARLRSRGVLVRHFATGPVSNYIRVTACPDEARRRLVRELEEIL